jgi:hypothetical protein
MKGMHKISRGRGFRGALDYAFDRDNTDTDPGRLLGGNMAGQNARELAAEFGRVRRLRPDIEKPVWHNALRLPAGEKLSDEQWVAIADDYMQRMGYTEAHPRAYVLHDDADGQHIHIVASRISIEGKVFLGKNENLASTRHIQALEKAHGLTITKGPEYDPTTGKIRMPDSRQVTKGEVEMGLRTQDEPPRQKLQRLINEAKADHPTAVQFAKRLTESGVTVHPNLASTGKLNGFSFALDGVAFKGSQLGDQYKWQRLQKEISYDQARDFERLEKYRAGTLARPIAATGAYLDTADHHLETASRTAGNIDQAAGSITDRAARRAVRAYLESTVINRGKITTTTTTTQPGAKMNAIQNDNKDDAIESDEPLDKRQRYKAQILEKHYKAQIEEVLARRLAYVKALNDQIIIGLQDANGLEIGKLIDMGDRITAGTGSDAEIEAMIALAKAKGWTGMKFFGSAEFRKRAAEKAVEAGIKVNGYKPKQKPEATTPDVMDSLAELINEPASEPVPPTPYEVARLAARQRAQNEIDNQGRKTPSSPSAPLPETSTVSAGPDPYLSVCQSEIQRIRAEIDEARSMLSKVRLHNIEDIRKQELDQAQNDPRFASIIDPVKHLFEKRQAADSVLEYAKELHAKRNWIGRAINVRKIAKLEREAAEAKHEHVIAAKAARTKILADNYVLNRIVSAEYENKRSDELSQRLTNLEKMLEGLSTLESELKLTIGRVYFSPGRIQRTLNPAEQSVLNLVNRNLTIQKRQEQLKRDQERQEEQLKRDLEHQERLRQLPQEQDEPDPENRFNSPFRP